MKVRAILVASLAGVAMLAAACGGSGGTAPTTGADTTANSTSSTAASGPAKPIDILRIGTTNYIDSFNPWNYIEAESTVAFTMIYPYLVQFTHGREWEGDLATSWDTAPDGKSWTFHLRPGQWSDGQPLTADDVVFSINTTIKFKDTTTAVLGTNVAHMVKATATDPETVVISFDTPVAITLANISGLPILPKHVYEPLVGTDGKGLKTFKPEQHMPIVTAGPYTLASYEKKGATVFKADPNFYGDPKPLQKAVTLNWYTNADSMIADMKSGQLDWVDEVPTKAVANLKTDPNVEVVQKPGAETTNITWNSSDNKQKNRELLDPKVKQALSMAVDRQRLIDVVYDGLATPVESIVGHIAGKWENANLGPLKFDIAGANAALDALGYTKGSDGIRMVPATTGAHAQPAHQMSYDIMTPTSVNYNADRTFEIIKAGFAQLGVDVHQTSGGDSTAAYAYETGDTCDGKKKGYEKFDMALWDWVGYPDPDFQLSVVTTGQLCSWSDTGWSNAAYDAEYDQQATLMDEAARKTLVDKMQQEVYDNVLYTQLVNMQAIDAHRSNMTGFDIDLSGYSKRYWTEVGGK
jgi:peptide/nickel transport system substrate-binding protein